MNVAEFTAMDRQIYEGMSAREILVWKQWLAQYGSKWDRFDYNVRVGKGAPVPPDATDSVRRMIELSSKQRIDVVGFQSFQPWIFEVKERALPAAMGQLLSYIPLYRAQFPTQPDPLYGIVSSRIDEDVKQVLKFHQIPYWIVNVDFSVLKGRR